jgi:ankyrin repeat protein
LEDNRGLGKVRAAVPDASAVGRKPRVMEAIAMFARRLDGFGHVAWLVSTLIAGGSAALLLTACQSAGPAKVQETVPAPQVAAAQANPDSPSAADAGRVSAPKALVPGVPFVSFAEAARIRLPHMALMYSNPSQTACLAMNLKYWGYSQELLERTETPEVANWVVSRGEARSFDEVKDLLVKGVPVQVVVALTPYGDRFPDTEPIAETVKKVGAAEGPRSSVLGRIMRFEDLPKIDKEWGINAEQDPMHVALFGSCRLVIGYDDERKVVVLHDPTFGPAFEMSYDDFMPTWEVLGKRYAGSSPPDYAKRLAKRGAAKPYRPRSPQEQAAEHYVYGYALNATGRPKEGEEQFRKGLAIPGIGPGYQHLFQLELAIALTVQGDGRGALEAAEAAATLVPEDPMPWWLLADLYAHSSYPDAAVKAEEARGKGDKLANDENAVAKLSSVLPRDFWVMTLGHWAGRDEVETTKAPSAGQSSPTRDSELHEAAEQGDLSRVNALIAAKANPNAKDSDGNTALMLASDKGHTDVVRALLAAKADVNAKNGGESTALIRASINGHTAVVQALLAAKADVNAKGSTGDTALTWASSFGHTEVVQALIAAKADVNAKDMQGETALMGASSHGYATVVQALLAAKADVNAKSTDGNTALMGASFFGHMAVVQSLLTAKADVNAKDIHEETALMEASAKGHAEVVRVLLDAKADVNAKRTEGFTALIWASALGHTEVGQALLAAKADVNAKSTADLIGLMEGFYKGDIEMFYDLRNLKAHMNAKRTEGLTALMFASVCGHTEVVQALLAAKADVDAKTTDGDTALTLAKKKGHDEVARLLENR